MLSHLGVWLGIFEQGSPWSPPDGIREYRGVATAAVVHAASSEPTAERYFEEGVEWLQRRRYFVPGQANGLEADPLSCVALAAGIRASRLTPAARWLSGLVAKAVSVEASADRADLFELARALASGNNSSWETVSPVLAIACAPATGKHPSADLHQRALENIISLEDLSPELALFHQAALRSILTAEATVDFAKPAISQVVQLLKGLSAALKRWPWEEAPKTKRKDVSAQRWDVQHEYHVQSLAWAVLRPVFPSLEDEENLPSLGHKHPRADLALPGLRLIVEVKYLKEATQSARAKVIEEVAADTGIYLTDDSGYDTIIALIWDATRSSNHHAELEAGMRKIRGIADVVIVSRPGEWN